MSLTYRAWMTKAVTDLRLSLLPITIEYADVQSSLPHHHGDPFDRLIIAQAIAESVGVISNDVHFDAYGITRIW